MIKSYYVHIKCIIHNIIKFYLNIDVKVLNYKMGELSVINSNGLNIL